MRIFFPALLLLSSLTLSGCVSEQQADAKLSKGCQAGVEAMIAPKIITKVNSVNYSDEQTIDGLFRRVTIKAVEKDGWLEGEKEYSCLFSQSWGLFRSSHSALLEQLTVGDQTLGKKDGRILGSMDDFLKLTGSAETAMGQ